jgi:TolB protein
MAISPDGESMVISNWELGGPKTWYLVKSDGSEPVVLASDQPYYRYIDWSPDGRKLLLQLLTDAATITYNIFVYDIDTQALTQLTDRPLNEYPPSYRDSSPMWSPDGSRILFVRELDREPTVFVMNADGSGLTQLTDDLPIHHMPLWSPDGSQIAFTVYGTPTGTLLRADLYVMNADGSGLKKLAEQIGGIGLSWSSDSAQLVYSQIDPGGATEQNPHGNSNLYIVDVASGQSRQLTANEADDEYPVWSPNGQYIAFGSNREGEFNLWLLRPDGTDLRRLENERAIYPYWSPDSQSLILDRLVPFVEYTFPARNREENSIIRAYLSDFAPSDSTP